MLLSPTAGVLHKGCTEREFSLFFFLFSLVLGGLDDFRLENAEMTSGDKAC